MSRSAITIIEIARMLGLSKSTVSRALAGHRDVNEDTRKKVLELAQKLDYQPNVVALHLRQQRTRTLGVIIPETMNRFFAKAIGGMQQVASQAGYNVIICQSNESLATEKMNVRTLLSNRVDGLIVSVSGETDRYDHFDLVSKKNIPIVFFDRVAESIPSSKVISNNYEISKEATLHLIKQGCKRIAVMAGPQYLYNSRNRLRGYIDAIHESGLECKEKYILQTDFKLKRMDELVRYLVNMKEKPDAIFAINDMAALEMIHVLKNMGYRIPEDIAVMGFNNEPICKFVDPPLTSIDHPADEMGRSAAALLINHLETGNATVVERCIKSQLIIRGSTHRIKK
ncbi:MAG: LacI family transcriptional regulator [Cyclobacteriaceae bacterium]|nr:MAG: LacI family transcriptional regulator [Cyclobacteriaceae bacterium]